MILAPCRFLSEPEQIRACDMVMVAYFAPAHTGEKTLSVIRVGLRFVAEAIGFLVVDAVKSEPGR
jgi:hypothetical protein